MNLSRAKTLYRLVSRNQRLSVQRHPLVMQNKAMKWFYYIVAAFWAAYLIFFGTLLGRIDDMSYEVFDFVDGGMVFFLTGDFLLRFLFQETPAHEIKPYKLLPIPQRFLLNLFLVRMGLRTYNLFLGFFLVPFALFSLLRFYGLWGMAGYLLGWWLMMVTNSYWYLLWRTLMQRHSAFLAVPLVFYAALIYLGIFFTPEHTWLFDATLQLGRGFVSWQGWAFLLPAAAITVLFVVDRRLQQGNIYSELAHEERPRRVEAPRVSGSKIEWLSRRGPIGQYLLLDLRSTRRNKVVRTQFITGVSIMTVFCLVLAFTDIYDAQPFMRCFIVVYCFCCMGVMNLTNIMSVEGNYIDLLMSRRETVLSLLREKYLFNCILILVPFLVSLLPVAQGKLLLAETVGSALFTMGGVFPFIFQLAVYNKAAIPLNARATRSNSSTRTQMFFSSAALFVPIILMQVLIMLFSRTAAAVIMGSIGLCGVVLSPLWLRNIYRRFMLRRYQNMEGFRVSRDTF